MSVDRLAAHFNRFGQAAILTHSDGGTTSTGTVIYDAQGQDVLGAAIQSTEHEVLYRATEFTGMETGDTFEFGGRSFRVRNIESIDDGALRRASLSALD